MFCADCAICPRNAFRFSASVDFSCWLLVVEIDDDHVPAMRFHKQPRELLFQLPDGIHLKSFLDARKRGKDFSGVELHQSEMHSNASGNINVQWAIKEFSLKFVFLCERNLLQYVDG